MAVLIYSGLLSICLSSVILSTPLNSPYKMIDMSYDYDQNETIVWPSHKTYSHKRLYWGPLGKVPFVASFEFETGEHVGTHMDAPLHFYEKGQTLDQVPLESVVGEAVVINITAKAEKNPDYLVTVSDLEEWEKEYGRMPENPIVFLYSGYGKYWPDRVKYFGSKTPDDPKTHHYPGLHPKAAKWLVEKRNLKLFGADLISIDAGNKSDTFPVHRILATKNIPGIENVANLHRLPLRGSEVFAAPMKMKGGSGGPTRLFARIYGNGNKPVNGCTALNKLNFSIVTTLLVTIFAWFVV